MPIGRVKFYDPVKGFGFITADDCDFFVDGKELIWSGLAGLSKGEAVEYDTATDRVGRPRAAKIRILTPEARQA